MMYSIAEKGDELGAAISAIKQLTGAPKVIVIAHSLGGLDARSYLENLGTVNSHRFGMDTDVVALTTIDTPHQGTPLAALSSILINNPLAACFAQTSLNIDELVPGSSTLNNLNYNNDAASDIPATVAIDSMVNYVPWTLFNYPLPYSAEDPVFFVTGQGILSDGAVSADSQDLHNALTNYPSSLPRPNIAPLNAIPFNGSCSPLNILHQLPCVGAQSSTATQVESDITSSILQNSIDVEPNNQPLIPGQTQQFTATKNNSSQSVYYTILEDPTSLLVDDFGRFTASSPGVYHVVATDTATGKQYGMATVTVSPAPTSSTLQISLAGNGTGGVTSSPQGISCGKVCSYAFPSNTSVILTAYPDQGVVVSAWSGCDTQAGSTCTVSMAEGRTVGVTFATEQSNELPAPTLSAVQIAGSAIAPVGTFSWSQVTHNSGYRILVSNQSSALPLDPNSYTCNPACLINTTIAVNSPAYTSLANTLVPGTTYYWQVHALAGTGYSPGVWSNVAMFSTSASPGQVQVTMQGSGSGTVTSSPSGISCPGVCSASFPANTSVTLSESPASGSQFVQWGGACVGASCTVTAAGVQSVVADFNLNANYTLNAAVSGSGTVTSTDGKISCSNAGGSCVASYPSGTVVTLNGTPATNYTLGGWSGACSGKGTCSFAMTQNQEVLAAFNVSSQPSGQLVVNIPSFAPVFTQGTGPATIGLSIQSSSGAPMLGNAAASEQSGGAWMTIDGHASETWSAPVTLDITFNPAGLSPGTYSGSITLSSSQASNSPVIVPVTLTVLAPLVITSPAALPDAFTGKPYSTTLQASGGNGLSWAIEQGTLPSGLTLNSTTGVISGTPVSFSNSNPLTLNIEVTDSSSRLAWQSFTMNSRQGVSVMLWDNSLLNMTIGSTLYQTAGTNFVASGGTPPYTWSATGLPPGVNLSSSGTFSGSPTALGQYNIGLTATDSTGLSGSLPLSVTTNELLLQIYDSQNRTPPLLATAVVGTQLSTSYLMYATGGTQTGYTWSVQGALPPGVSAGPSSGCVSNCNLSFTGTPTTAGTYNFTVKVTDSQSNSATTSQTWIVNSNANGPNISTTTLPQATIGQNYAQSLNASGGVAPLTWKVISGNLDPALALNASGNLSGTPSTPNECPFGPGYAPRGSVPTSFVVEVTDANAESDVQQLCLTSYFPQPTVASVGPQQVVPDGTPKTLTVTGTNFQPLSQLWVQYVQQSTVYVSPTQLQVTLQPSTSALFSLGGNAGGLVSGNWPIRVQAPYTLPSAFSSFNVDEAQPVISGVQATYGSTSNAPCTPNFPCQFAIGGSGFSFETIFQVAGSTQSISRVQVPAAAQPWTQITAGYFVPPQTGSYTLDVTNPNQPGGGSATAVGSFQVYTDGAIVATPASLATTFTQGDAGSSTGLLVQVAGIQGTPGTFAVSTQSGGNWLTVGGQVSGAWTSPQTLSVTFNPGGLPVGSYSGSIILNWPNATGGPVSVPLTMTIQAPLTILTSPILPTATYGQAYSTTVTGSGGGGLTWSLTSQPLPAGLTLNSGTGVISGVPTTVSGISSAPFDLGLQDSSGRYTWQGFSITVNAPPAVATQPTSQTVTLGNPATFTALVTGIPTPTYQWQYLSGSTWTNFNSGIGSTSASLTIGQTTAAENGMQLRLIASNGVGSPATSNVVTLNISPITPMVTVSPSSSSVSIAQPLTVTVTVNGGTGNPTPTGSVTLTSGGYASASVTLTSGSATIPIPTGSLAVGSDTLTVNYAPDSSSSSIYTSASGSAGVSVTPLAPTITFAVPNHTYGDAPFSVSATSNSSGTITYSVVSGPATISGSTVTLTGAGTVVLQAGQVAAGGYASGTQTATFTVAGQVPVISFAVPNHTYGDAPFTVSATSNSSGAITYSVVSGPATISGSTVTLTGAGSVMLQANQVASGNYSSGAQTATFTVAGNAPTITFTVSNHTYGDAPFTASATSNSTGAITYSVVSGPATISGSTVTLSGAGTVVLQASQVASGGYAAGTQIATFTVAGQSPVITFTVANHTFGNPPFTVSATSNSSGAIIYSVVSGPATISGSTVTLTGAGTVVLQANQAASGGYSPGTQTTSFTVAGNAPTINFSVPNHTYGDAPFTVSATSNSSGAITYSVVSGPATISGSTVTLTGAGTVVLQASQAAVGNYASGTQTATFTVAGQLPTINFTVPNHTYGDAPFAVSATSNSSGAITYSVVSGPATISGSTVTLTGAGTVVLQASQVAAGGYSPDTQTATFTVAGNAPTITFAVPNHTYGDTPFAVSATSTSSGAITYSVVSGPVTISGSTVTLTGAGTVVLQASQAAAGGYTSGTQTATFTVAGQAPTITFTVPNHTYGDAAFTVSVTSNSSGAVTYSVVSGSVVVTGSTVTLTGAGTVVLQASQAAAGSYIAGAQTATFTVATETQTITFAAPGSPVSYGVAPISLSASSSSGLTVTFSVLSGQASVSGSTLTITGAGTILVAANQPGNANYAAAEVTRSITVNKIAPAVGVAASPNPVLAQSVVTLTATASSPVSMPTGSVVFSDGGTALGTANLSAGIATLTISTLTAGTHSITAGYGGDVNFSSASSAVVSETVQDFTFTVGGSGSSETVSPGGTATFTLPLSPSGGTTFPAAVTFSASGLPSGFTASFNPTSLFAGSSATNVGLVIRVPGTAMLEKNRQPGRGLPMVALGMLILPLVVGRIRRPNTWLRLTALAIIVAGVGGVATLTGCGGGGNSGQPRTYNITVTATSGTLSHSTGVTLTVQ